MVCWYQFLIVELISTIQNLMARFMKNQRLTFSTLKVIHSLYMIVMVMALLLLH